MAIHTPASCQGYLPMLSRGCGVCCKLTCKSAARFCPSTVQGSSSRELAQTHVPKLGEMSIVIRLNQRKYHRWATANSSGKPRGQGLLYTDLNLTIANKPMLISDLAPPPIQNMDCGMLWISGRLLHIAGSGRGWGCRRGARYFEAHGNSNYLALACNPPYRLLTSWSYMGHPSYK